MTKYLSILFSVFISIQVLSQTERAVNLHDSIKTLIQNRKL